ncbi:MAG: glycosyltransferase family 1 protein, partial [Muribaculaceae bacterium]|nr:glycosyltransferase family 1 protein [Muribaculaceae bacterium]
MKALLLGDASNYHFSLACALRARGHDVTVASDGSRWMDTRRDIDLTRRPGKLGGALLWLRLNTLLARDLRGYDVVQLVAPTFLPLRPCRLLPLFRRLKRDNGAVYLTALGTDSSLVGNLLGPSPALRYSEYNTPAGPSPWSASADARCDQWLERGLREYTDEIYNGVG